MIQLPLETLPLLKVVLVRVFDYYYDHDDDDESVDVVPLSYCKVDHTIEIKCLLVMEKFSYSCKMGTSDFPDLYVKSLRVKGIHIRQIMSAHVTAIM